MSREYILQPFRASIPLQIDYERELNKQQFAAVTAPPGPSLVIAGAGSGKTRTLTYRVAYLLEQGIPPERILLLTFTNKAAKEMMRRVTDLLGQELASLWGGTFHSIGNRILRQHAELLGYDRSFSILDREDAENVVATCVEESDIDLSTRGFPKAEVLAEIFSKAVNKQQSVEATLSEDYSDFLSVAPAIESLRETYQARKRTNNAMDFDDLLALWLHLLKEHQTVLEQYQRRFQFILVDEYQDTNKLQSDLIDLLAERHQNLMVVGDDAQSIYAWRGANFANILKFTDRYSTAKVYRIETNYRSTPEILEVANAAIAANVHQFTKQLTPARKPGTKPNLVACGDPLVQAAFVAQRVLELREEGTNLNQMAILYRSHFHALQLQLELTRRNIPFSITSGIRFFEQAHIKDIAAYMKFVTNPRDELSFKRLAQLLRGIGPRSANKLWEAFMREISSAESRSQSSTGTTHSNSAPEQPSKPEAAPSSTSDTASLLQRFARLVPRKAVVDWAQFIATIAQLEADEIRHDGAEMIRLILEAGFEDYVKENYKNSRSRLDDLEQLAQFAEQFPNVSDFLTELALLTNIEAEEERTTSTDDEQLRLSTVHQAKGLEFDVVFVIMLCDGMFPSARSLAMPESEEEERRLMYVAITRARNELYLTYPLLTGGYTEGGATLQRPSRFLGEIPKELLEEWNLRTYA